MIQFDAPGSEVARVIANARLFVGDGLRFPMVVLIEIDEHGFAAAGSDGYSVGRDIIGDVPRPEWVQITDEDAERIEKAARSLRRSRAALSLAEGLLTLSDGPLEHIVPVAEPDERWPYLLDLLEPVEPPETHVAFASDRLTRFGRVKTLRDAPVDIRLEPTDDAPIALMRIGPSFRGALKAIDREQSARNLGEEQAAACFWEE